MIKLSEKFEIEYWERMDHPENGNGYVVVIYDSPDESRNSVAFANVHSGAELEKAWKAFCGDDPEIGIIKSVMWCAGIFRQ